MPNILEREKYDAQNPFAVVYDVHNSVSLGSDGNSGARLRSENSASRKDKFLVCV